MAAKKKKKTKKATKAVKARKAPAKKSKAKKAAKRPAKKARKIVKAAAKKAPARKAVAAKKNAPAKKKKQIVGEGDYAASKSFDKDQASFVAKNKANIPAMGQAAEKALEGPEGAALREAEAAAAARSRDTF
jgi:hypothetical protein